MEIRRRSSADRRLSVCLKSLLVSETLIKLGITIYVTFGDKSKHFCICVRAYLMILPVVLAGLAESGMVCGEVVFDLQVLGAIDW